LTYKLVGAIRGLGHLPAHQLVALEVGFGLGLVVEVLRKLLRASARYRAFVERPALAPPSAGSRTRCSCPAPRLRPRHLHRAADGAVVGKRWHRLLVWNTLAGGGARAATDELPADMSTTSLVGGGLIAGESLFYLAVALIGLSALV
jgi:hypothetical protein